MATSDLKFYWRTGVKQKIRSCADFLDLAKIRMSRIEEFIYPDRIPLDNWKIRQAYYHNPGKYEFLDKRWRSIRIGETWGGKDYSAFFKRTVTIPREFKDKKVVLRIYVGGDSLLSIDGVPYHGLDPFRDEVPLTARAKGNEIYHIDIESFVAWHWEEYGLHTFSMAELATVDEEIVKAYWDFQCLIKMLDIPNIDEELKAFIVEQTWPLLKQVPLHDEPLPIIRKKIITAARGLRRQVYESGRFRIDGLMHLVGHSHLDIVFMWPYREFIRKVGRTHATMLRLMEQYPQFKFGQSQAKLYADLKEHFPDLFEQVKKRVKEGRWELMGAFWVEPDCNLISGESFVRQIMHGQRFFEREFGIRSRSCWQPDVFGVSWALPQILKRSGIEYFLTNKMVVWNDTNPWTKNAFWWEGLDGSQIFSIVPSGHFIGTVDPDHLHSQWTHFSDKNTIGETLHIYGWGDGGGGPDPEMIESGTRYRHVPGLPDTTFSSSEEAFDRMKIGAAGTRLPVHRDELYLEAHRGTYTTRGRLKKLNRRMECLLREAELYASLASLGGKRYPSEPLNRAWEDLLTTQFHDALPGTHIAEVYTDLLKDYDRIEALAESVRSRSLIALLPRKSRKKAAIKSLAVFNSALHARNDILCLPTVLDGAAVRNDGEPVIHQDITDIEGNSLTLCRIPEIPPLGCRIFELGTADTPVPTRSSLKATPRTLENEYLKVKFNSHGEIVSILDKEHKKEVLPPNSTANRFQLFEDTPGRYEAWDIIIQYKDHEIDIRGGTLHVDETGPIRASLVLEKKCLTSSIRQRISLYAGERRIVFETFVDWVERQRLLKVAFPVDVETDHATYDIAFGNMQRANHANTSYGAARFEVAGIQWMDMSQPDYGVSLITDCKYGYEADGKLMRLSLLKGAIFPDPEADRETHSFTYSLYPHADTWREAQTVKEAFNMNNPLHACPAGSNTADTIHSFMKIEAPGITLEAVKQAEDEDGLIVRLVERLGARTSGSIVFDKPVRHAWVCNLMEKKESKLPVKDGRIDFSANPYEIVTIRATF